MNMDPREFFCPVSMLSLFHVHSRLGTFRHNQVLKKQRHVQRVYLCTLLNLLCLKRR